ncbi:uncharacterized protein LOC143041641 [Oratosquilla oratoria]|uniref:uncharacterized protein LOC143041641 n=1 Tax=Oratosquilla oratoria TaxID=337810 RepID=UPI003F75E7DD
MFNLENFVKEPSAEEVRKLNKAELEMIAHHYQISECSGLNKNPLKDKILEYLEENELIHASREDVVGASPVNDLALQVELKKLELEIERLKSQSHGIEKTPNIPKFNEDKPDKFFSVFEKLARMYQWPFSQWTQMVYGALSGKALDTFIALSESQSSDYYVLKYNILQAYQLVPEAYRQQFRKCWKSNQETYVECFRRKLRLFTRWVESEEAHVDLEKLKGLILMEDIRNNIPPDVRANLDQRGIRTLAEAGPAADYYRLTNPRMHSRSHPTLPQSFPPPTRDSKPVGPPQAPRPPAHSSSASSTSVALDQDSPPTSIKLLRDTGSALSLITKDVAALIDAYYTGNWVLVNGLTGGSRIPICQVYLRSDVRTGYAQVGVVDKLPVEGVSLLIGNDLAGGTMLPNAIVSSCPSAENNTSQLEADIPGIFPACAVTRSMSRRVEAEISEHKEDAHVGVIIPQPSENTEDVPTQPDLADLNLGEFFSTSPPPGDLHNRFDNENDTEGDNVTTLDSFGSSPVTRSKLIHLQKEDPELASCFRRAISEEEAKSESNCYYLSSDILMRKFRPTDSPANHPWSVRHQIMVPNPLQKEILGIAHDGVGGHLGVRKTSAKILTHFYWPKMKRDISSYISTCHRCQVAGKPHPSVKPFPLQPIPVIEEPFGRIVIDCVGPLPKTPRGNQFLFTMIDCATRYPEAIPLRRITAKNVVRALIYFFTQVDLPTVVQSNQGSNFTSRLFNQKEYVREEVQRLQEVGIVEPSSSPWASPVVLVPKPDGSTRLCVDYRKVNAVTEPDSCPLPRIDDVIEDVGRAQWVTKLDLLQGYYQVRLSERSRAISVFITPEGLYQFTVLPFGLRNAPATFQRLMNIVTAGLVGVRCYLDDLVVFSDSWGEHVDRLRALFVLLAAHSLTVNLAKSEFGHARITFLGHVVGKGEVQPIAAKITAILRYPAPSDKKGVMRLLGMADYYRRFCPSFSSVVAPLTDLLRIVCYILCVTSQRSSSRRRGTMPPSKRRR